MTVITTKECPRCSGSGQYSYCQMYGTMCFQCGGRGIVPCAPLGQKKIPTTANDVRSATIGDIVSINHVLYQVVQFKWIPVQHKGFDSYNQSIEIIRLVDGKKMYVKRGVFAPDWEGFNNGQGYSEDEHGVKKPLSKMIVPTEEMIGTIVMCPVPEYSVVEEVNGVAVVESHGKLVLRMRNENGILVYIPGYSKEYARKSAILKVLKELTSDEQAQSA